MGKQARIRRDRRDGTGLAGAYKRAMRAIVRRKDLVEFELRKPDFGESLKVQAELLAGTPGEITSEAGLVQLVRQILEARGVSSDGLLITAALRMGRLQLWTRIHPHAAGVAAREAREQLLVRDEAARASAAPAAAQG